MSVVFSSATRHSKRVKEWWRPEQTVVEETKEHQTTEKVRAQVTGAYNGRNEAEYSGRLKLESNSSCSCAGHSEDSPTVDKIEVRLIPRIIIIMANAVWYKVKFHIESRQIAARARDFRSQKARAGFWDRQCMCRARNSWLEIRIERYALAIDINTRVFISMALAMPTSLVLVL